MFTPSLQSTIDKRKYDFANVQLGNKLFIRNTYRKHEGAITYRTVDEPRATILMEVLAWMTIPQAGASFSDPWARYTSHHPKNMT